MRRRLVGSIDLTESVKELCCGKLTAKKDGVLVLRGRDAYSWSLEVVTLLAMIKSRERHWEWVAEVS